MSIDEAYRENFQLVYKYLFGLTGGNDHLAEELTQETFYRATKKIKEFRGDCKLSTWLCQIAKYVFYQEIDKKKRRKEVSLDVAVECAASENLEKKLIDQEQKLAIYQSIQKLDPNQKDVMMLRLSGNLSFREIGVILGQSENWARVNFYRGKKVIEREVQNYEI